MHGIRVLTGVEAALIFGVLAAVAWLASRTSVSAMAPGSRHPVDARVLLAGGTLALLATFAVLFHDYRMDGFVREGLVCLKAGLLHAAPAALLMWLVLRRGFAVDTVAAGIAVGTVAGLAGVGMLELHCPNLKAMHLMVWHVAVIPVSGAAGAVFAGWRRLAAR